MYLLKIRWLLLAAVATLLLCSSFKTAAEEVRSAADDDASSAQMEEVLKSVATENEEETEDEHDEVDSSEEIVEEVPADMPVLEEFTEDQLATLKSSTEAHEFQAEVYRLMDIIINSLYTRKEVFLRELISNCADALEKIRFLAIEDDTALGDTKDLRIVVEYDSDAKTITIIDSGVGMTKQDLINNLGTVAKSGTSNFLEAVAHGGDVNLIGQFGVGFYSAFLVADRVTVVSKSNDDPHQHIWESTADASFTVVEDPRGPTLGRGTSITLHMKEDAIEFLARSKLTDLLKKYSQFVNFPIYLKVTKTVYEEVPVEEKETDDEDKDEAEVAEEDAEEKPKTKKVPKSVAELKKINVQKPLWMRSKDEITDDEYSAFYRSLIGEEGSQAPLTQIHFQAEGEIEFKALLFVPPRMSSDPYAQYFNKKHDVKLYVRRVLVSDQFEDLIPNWLSFVKGVIDSDDLPLKVDRESVSQLKVIKVISKRVTRKILDVLRKVASDSETSQEELDNFLKTKKEEEKEQKDYSAEEKDEHTRLTAESNKFSAFWRHFGRNVKLGCADDDGGNRQKIAKLLRYNTSKNVDKVVSLQSVVDRMAEGQNTIYYMTGENAERMMESPLIKGFVKKGIEVVLLSDAVDEQCMITLADFDGKKLVSIEKGEIKLDETEEEKAYFDKLKKHYNPFLQWWRTELSFSAKIGKVQLTNRLVDDPVAIVASSSGQAAFGEKITRYQTFVDQSQMLVGKLGRILEVNPQHALVRKMKDMFDENKENETLKEIAINLMETAAMASGYPVDRPTHMADQIYDAMAKNLNIENVQLEPVEVPETAEDAVDEEMDESLAGDDDGEAAGSDEEEAAASSENDSHAQKDEL